MKPGRLCRSLPHGEIHTPHGFGNSPAVFGATGALIGDRNGGSFTSLVAAGGTVVPLTHNGNQAFVKAQPAIYYFELKKAGRTFTRCRA